MYKIEMLCVINRLEDLNVDDRICIGMRYERCVTDVTSGPASTLSEKTKMGVF